MSDKPIVHVIQPTTQKENGLCDTQIRKRRVAAYARVSTDDEEQLTSYENQIRYYTQYISSNPEWEFAGIYTDEGISGVNTKARTGFRQMVEDSDKRQNPHSIWEKLQLERVDYHEHSPQRKV